MFLLFKKAWNLWIRFNITCICMRVSDVRVTVAIAGCSCRQFNVWSMDSRCTFEITYCVAESISDVIPSRAPAAVCFSPTCFVRSGLALVFASRRKRTAKLHQCKCCEIPKILREAAGFLPGFLPSSLLGRLCRIVWDKLVVPEAFPGSV